MELWREHRSRDLTPLRDIWRAAAAAPGNSIFQRFELAQEWALAFAEEADVRVWFHADIPLIAPFARRGGKLTFLGAGMFDYCDLVGAAWPMPNLDDLVEILAGAREELELAGLREDSPFFAFWRRVAPEWTGQFAAPHRDVIPFANPAAGLSAGALLDAGHARVAKRLRAAELGGARFAAVSSPPARAECLEWLLRRKDARLAALGRENVLGPRAAVWLRRMADLHPELCEIWTCEMAGERAAGFLTWRDRDVRYGYLLAFDARFARLSPGILLLYYVLRAGGEEGLRMDFLTGEQDFKLRFADGARRLFLARRPAAEYTELKPPIANSSGVS